MKLAFLLALVGVTLLFVFVFRSVRRPLMAVLAMLLAVAWTFGLAAVYPGYLNLLSIVFALILIGLGIDFGIYFLSAYEEARSVAPEVPVAIRATLARVGKPILYGAITTVIAFYTAMFVDFRGVAELGLLAGTGVLFCLLSMFIVLPSLLLVGDQEGPSPAQEPRSLRVRYPVRVLWILLLAAGLTIGMVPGLLKLRFSYNPRKLQAKGLQSVTYEKVVQEQSGQSTWFGVVTAPTREALRKKVDALARLKQVKQVRSVLDVWPLTTSARRERLAQLARLFPPVGPRSKAPPAVGRCVGLYRKLSGLFEQAGDDLFLSRPQQAERLLGLAQASTGLAEQLADLPPRTASQRLEELQAALFAEMDGTIARVRRLLGSREIRQQDLPEFYRRLFVARDHPEFAAHVYPAFDIAQGDRMEDYMEACLGVDSGFTGPPMLFYRTSRLMRYGFERASLYALVAVLLVLVVTLRDPLSVALALTPLGLGLTWTGGLMGYLGMPLDLANCFGVPILLGIGVDVGIHLVHAFRATGAVDKIWSTTGRAVVVTTLTTMIGFGSMLIAHHRGLAGLGTLVTLGMCATLLASLGVLPAVFRLIEQSPPDETTDATPEPLAPDPERLDPAAEPPGRATD